MAIICFNDIRCIVTYESNKSVIIVFNANSHELIKNF